ncbi:UDP-glucose 4-epimerase GalE [Fulvivirgaceae bacterium PWU20]|uniref:UDP-glucose 4-epimerase n=2 Tax=Chryseosolibacter indicus TaxID=2782351 RepID=A0ABS5VT46_9BACT|nr:UDP-glucose 4-epimerase GalE [Chryseosolibacter indicus]MBT1704582.1 UDP-glucose 4-epimerase GalE [Chryseosolibacter indicus]
MSNKKVLVTGGAGFIGAHTAVELIQAGYETVIVDNFSKSDRTLLDGMEKILGKKPTFLEGDCTDKEFLQNIFSTQGPFSCVLHFAAFKSVNESVEKPLAYYRNNVGSLIALLEVMKENNVADIIFSSSCTVYGQPDSVQVDENTPFKKAESPYGATKQMCERILEDAYKTGYRVISLRYFNPIGAHPSALIGELPIGVPGNLVPFITQTAAGKREKLTVFGNDYNTPDGSCIRDFIHVVDVATAHVKAMEYLDGQPKENLYDVFNLGTGVGASVLELVELFKKVTGVNLPYTIGPRRPGDVEKVYANADKLNKAFNWKTRYTMAEGLLHAWQWEKKLMSK